MKRNILVFGLILGVIISLNLVYVTHLLYNNSSFKGNDLIGYASQVLIFSLSFFGIRNYRNKEPGGFISFGKAFKVGALIAVLGSTIYVAFWLAYYYLAVPDFIDVYSNHVLTTCQADGATATEITSKKAELSSLKEMYQNPLFIALITYMEVLPVGLAVALISALILKKKESRKIASKRFNE